MSHVKNADHDLAIKAAWLYHIHGLGQEEVARRLHLSRSKVTRLLSHARENGIVKISIEHEISETMALADWIAANHRVKNCILTPLSAFSGPEDALGGQLGRQAVGIVAANYVSRRLQAEKAPVLGLGSGRTVAEMVKAFPSMLKSDLTLVSLTGAAAHDDGNSAYSLVLALSAVTGGRAVTLPVPLMLGNPAVRQALEHDPSASEILGIAHRSRLKVLSCGDCSAENTFSRTARLNHAALAELVASGAVCEVGGCFLTASGALAPTRLNQCTMGVTLAALEDSEVVIVAAGRRKAKPLCALLNTGLVHTLIIDHALAEELAGKTVRDRV